MQSELRRQRDTLATSGLAIVVLNFWNLLRSSLLMTFGAPAQSSDGADLAALIDGIDPAVALLALIGFLVIALIDFVFSFYVGISAISEGRGRPKGYAHVVFACLASVRCVFSIVIVMALARYSSSLIGTVSSIILDLSALYAFVEIARSSISVKRLLRGADAGWRASARKG